MGKHEDIYRDVISGKRDANIRFSDLCSLLKDLGFIERIKGDHFIFYKEEYPEIINIQPDGSKAKPYQVKQIRRFFNRYKI